MLVSATIVAVFGVSASVASADDVVPDPLPPAPAGFADSLTSLYSTLYDTVGVLGSNTGQVSTEQLRPPTDFAGSVQSLDADGLATIYAATQQTSNWDQMAADAQRLLTDARAAAGTGSPALSASSPALRTVHRLTSGPIAMAAQASAGNFPPPEPTGAFPAPLSPFQPSNGVNPFSRMTCFAGASPYDYYRTSDLALFMGATLDKVADNVNAALPSLLKLSHAPSFPNPAKIIVLFIKLAGKVVVDGFTYARAVVNSCGQVNAEGFAANLDNTTVNTYNLEQQNEQTIAAIESSINTIHEQVRVVQQTVNAQLTLNIRRALSQPTTAPKNVIYELPASAGGNLDSTPIGVRAIVTGAYNAAKQAGLPIIATATNSLAAANSALSVRNYRTAWTNFQLAYQALR